MCEDLPKGHPVLIAAAEIGDELAERHVERELSLADERQHERGRRELRERGEVEERSRGAWAVRARARIGTERASCIRVDRAATLHAHDGGGAERSDRLVEDRFARVVRT